MKKTGIFMSLLMALTLSFCMSLIGSLTSGHFTVGSWLISFAISLVISLVIGLIVPMPKLESAACRKLKLRPGTVKANFVSALISNTIYTPLLSIVMSVIMVSAATSGINGEITRTESMLSEVSANMAAANEELEAAGEADPAKAGELRARIGELTGQYNELNGKLAGLNAAKPPMGMAILVSLLWCYPSGLVIIFIVQPLYMKMLIKKFGPPQGVGGPHIVRRPPAHKG